MKSRMALSVCAITVASMFSGGSLPGQDPFSVNPKAKTLAETERIAHELMGRLEGDSAIEQADSAVQEALNKYRDAGDEKEKGNARKEMSTALSDYFDADMQLREQEIRDIEERVKKLQAQLERRRAAKAELLDLQLKVLVNEAEGLGFYGRGGSTERPRAGRIWTNKLMDGGASEKSESARP